MSGHLADDTLVALALGELGAAERRALLPHLTACADCSANLQGLESAVLAVVAAAPTMPAPPGLADRVVAAHRVEAAPATRPAPGRSRTVLAVAAAALLLGAVLGAAGTVGLLGARGWQAPAVSVSASPSPPTARSAPLLTADGKVGLAATTALDGRPVLALSVTAGRPGTTYECILLGRDDSRSSGGSWTLDGAGYGASGSGTWLVPLGEQELSGVELVGPSGKVWATATF